MEKTALLSRWFTLFHGIFGLVSSGFLFMGISPRNHIHGCNFPPPPPKENTKTNMSFFQKNWMRLEDDSTHKRTCRFFKILWEWKMIRCLLRWVPLQRRRNSLNKFGKRISSQKPSHFQEIRHPDAILHLRNFLVWLPKKQNKKRKGEMGIVWWRGGKTCGWKTWTWMNLGTS